MTIYKICIDNRNYESWTIFDATTLTPITTEYNINPTTHKLFNNDVFSYTNTEAKIVEIIHSSLRVSDNIPAVLMIAGNKSYGRKTGKTYNIHTKPKLMYKCIPDDMRIPAFLVPYEIKQLGFSKIVSNLYVTIKYESWDNIHPHGILTNVIGPVDILDNFYEYQLYCKSLNASIQKFNKDTNKIIKDTVSCHDTFIEIVCNQCPSIENRTDWNVFTIDPPNSLDFDDGFSIKLLDNGLTLLSIYIANVTIWMDSLNLWDSFSQRISTIYLPDRKRPMLPTILSDCLCSLQANAKRFAFTLDIIIDTDYNVVSTKYSNCLINVFKNFAYEEPALLINPHYKMLFDVVKQLSHKYKYNNYSKNSHDVVCYLMIFMNYNCAKELLKHNNGIFRSTIINTNNTNEKPDELLVPDNVSQFIKNWNSVCGQYVDIHSITDTNIAPLIRHDTLEMDAYVHITSPIRRLVDLLNIIKFQSNYSLITLSPHATKFYNKWIEQIDYINVTMRSIRKIQNDCSLLDMCFNNPKTLDTLYDGYCFDKIVRNDGLYQYVVYLPDLKLASKITIRENINSYEKKQFKLYLFSDEEKCKKKIRLQLNI
jgi:exoribonuclease R